MEVFFEAEPLKWIETDRAAETRLPVGVIQAARRKLNAIRAAIDEENLRSWRSLRFQPPDAPGAECVIWLDDDWSLGFRVDASRSPNKVTVSVIKNSNLRGLAREHEISSS
jgi:toxin HigB-1